MISRFNWYSVANVSDGAGGSVQNKTLVQSISGNLQFASGTKQVFAGGKEIVYDYRIICDRIYAIADGDMIDEYEVLHVESWSAQTMKATIIYVRSGY